MQKLLIVLLFLSIGVSANAHKFYTSITDVSFNENSKTLEIIVKLFIDDFEKAIEDSYEKRLYLGTEREEFDQNNLIEKYINKHFEVNIKSNRVPLSYIGKETDRDYIWIYIEVVKVRSISEISIKNTLLTDLFPDQTNLINLETESGIKSVTLHKDLPQHSF